MNKDCWILVYQYLSDPETTNLVSVALHNEWFYDLKQAEKTEEEYLLTFPGIVSTKLYKIPVGIL